MSLRTRLPRLLPRLLLGAAIAGAALWLALGADGLDPAAIEAAIADLGPWGALAHVVLFAAATVLFLPGVIFGLAGGALFGPVLGSALSLAGATLGATASFLLARYLAADRVRRMSGPRLDRLIAGVEAEGWRFVALTRLVPLVPFNLLNYALGLTRIRLGHYVLASAVCMVPGTVAYTWLGHAGREAIAGGEGTVRNILLAVGLLAIVAFIPRLVRRFRRRTDGWIEAEALKRDLDGGGPLAVIDVRGPDEFDGPLGHIPGARNIPVDAIGDRLSEVKALGGERLILVCKTDKRSARAADILRAAGSVNVAVVRGGMERWAALGYATESHPASAPAAAETESTT